MLPKGIFHRLARVRWVLTLVGVLGIYRAFNLFLRLRPVYRRLPQSGAQLRIKSSGGFALLEEFFSNGLYQNVVAGTRIRTFADLGCNVGWFVLYLLETTGQKNYSGILIDANPEMVDQAAWHLEKNGFQQCNAVWGAVGCPTQ